LEPVTLANVFWKGQYESWLQLSIVLYFLVTPIATYISAKAYLTTGSLTLLFFWLDELPQLAFSNGKF